MLRRTSIRTSEAFRESCVTAFAMVATLVAEFRDSNTATSTGATSKGNASKVSLRGLRVRSAPVYDGIRYAAANMHENRRLADLYYFDFVEARLCNLQPMYFVAFDISFGNQRTPPQTAICARMSSAFGVRFSVVSTRSRTCSTIPAPLPSMPYARPIRSNPA